MEPAQLLSEDIVYGGVTVQIRERSNGFYKVYWREARKQRSTTKVKLTGPKGAREFAKQKARELSGKAGSRTVMQIEAEAIDEFKGLIGSRSLPGAVEQLKDAVGRLGGWEHVGRAFDNYIKAGHGRLDRSPAEIAVPRFLKQFKTGFYKRGLQKELQAFSAVNGKVSICDIDEDLLKAWIGRENEDGSPPGWRYFNNRLATWKTFLNRCRKWGMLVRDEDHAGELVQRMKKITSMPPIWEVDLVKKMLPLVIAELNESLAYFVTGNWMGLRPFEMHRVLPKKWDWTRDYLNIDAEVAQKVMHERFVPIPANVRALLYDRLSAPVAFWGTHQGRRPARHIVRSDDQVFLSRLFRDKGLINEWPQDVMRHSYISYRLAEGHGLGQVAEWSGNSEREIRKSYRRPLRKEEGASWFEIGL